jgi:hypothetical protein
LYGAAIVDIPLQPVSKNIFDVDSYPLERIAMTTGEMQLMRRRLFLASVIERR